MPKEPEPLRPFLLSVSDLIGRPGARRSVSLSGPLEMELDQVEECGPASARLQIEETSGGVLVRGGAAASMRLLCRRCLAPALFEVCAPVLLLCGVEAAPDEAGGEALPITPDGEIDLADSLRGELSLAVPLAPLCSQGCRGLCPACGCDLNTEPCGGHSEPSGSPFAVLEGLLEAPQTGG